MKKNCKLCGVKFEFFEGKKLYCGSTKKKFGCSIIIKKQKDKKNYKKRYQKNKNKYKKISKKYYEKHKNTDEYRRKRNLRTLNYYYRNHKKSMARRMVAKKLRQGILKKQPCKKCGIFKNIQAHHPDYSKPLKIIWLCYKCHLRIHYKY